MRELSVVLPHVVDLSNPPGDLEFSVLSEVGGIIRFPEKLLNAKGKQWKEDNPDSNAYKHIKEFWVDSFVLLPTPGFQQNGVQYLNPIQSQANNMINILQSYTNDDEEKKDWLQSAFNGLNDALISSLAGKRGILNRYLSGYRVRDSLMFVCTGSPRLKHDQIEIPRKYARNIGVESGDLVMYCRHPILHELSVRFARAVVISDSATGALPYRNFLGLGADCDGDQIVVFALPREVVQYPGIEEAISEDITDTVNRSEMHGSMLLYKKEKRPPVGEHFVSMCTECQTVNKLQMDAPRECSSCGAKLAAGIPMDLETLDTEERFIEDGLSFGPEDVINSGSCEFLDRLRDNDIKDTKDDFFNIFRGEADLIASAGAVLEEQSNIKLKLGFVGRTGSDALVAANFIDKPEINRSACYLKEKLSQQVLDCKHGEDLSNMETILGILCKFGEEYRYLSADEMVERAQSFGYNPQLLRPIIEYIAPFGVMGWVNRNSPVSRLLSQGGGNVRYLSHLNEYEGDTGGLGYYTAMVWRKWGIFNEIPKVDRTATQAEASIPYAQSL